MGRACGDCSCSWSGSRSRSLSGRVDEIRVAARPDDAETTVGVDRGDSRPIRGSGRRAGAPGVLISWLLRSGLTARPAKERSSGSFATGNHSGRYSTQLVSTGFTKETARSSASRRSKTRISSDSRRRSNRSTKDEDADRPDLRPQVHRPAVRPITNGESAFRASDVTPAYRLPP